MSNEIAPKKEILEAIESRVKKAKGKPGKIAGLIWDYHKSGYQDEEEKYAILRKSLEEEWDKPAGEVETLSEVLTPNFLKALDIVFGEEESAKLQKIFSITVKGLYSLSPYRRSYRSSIAGDYISDILGFTSNNIYWVAIDTPLTQVLTSIEGYPNNTYWAYQGQIALAIEENDKEVIDLVEDSIIGDNSKVQLSHGIISGIVRSGDNYLIELLGKLLVAAKLQEGLRQTILQLIDWGTCETATYFLKIVLENDLTRYSSVVSALDVWAGLGFTDQKPAAVKKSFELALSSLEDEDVCRKNLESNDALEVYFALWAMANKDIHVALKAVDKLLESGEKYKRLLAIYFVSNIDNSELKHRVITSHMDTEDLEELAWCSHGLYENVYATHFYWAEEKRRTPQEALELSQDKKVREKQFNTLYKAAKLAGKKKTKFDASIFPWVSVELDVNKILVSMMSIAAYDLDDGMIDRLAELTDLMDSFRRAGFYATFCDAKNPKHKEYLLNGLINDRSAENKERIAKFLGEGELTEDDLIVLSDALKSKSSGLRKTIIDVLSKQEPTKLKPILERLLTAKQETKIQAGLELMAEFKDKDKELFSYGNEFIDNIKTNKKLTEQTKILLNNLSDESSAMQKEFSKENGFGLYNPNADAFDVDKQRLKLGKETFSDKELKKEILIDEKELHGLLSELNKVFLDNAGFEYECYLWSSKEKVILGDNTYSIYPLAEKQEEYDEKMGRDTSKANNTYPLDCYPFHEEFEMVMKKYMKSLKDVIVVMSFFEGVTRTYRGKNLYVPEIDKALDGYPIYKEDFSKYEYEDVIEDILKMYKDSLDEENMFEFAMKTYRSLRNKLPESTWMDDVYTEDNTNYRREYKRISDIRYLSYWRDTALTSAKSDEDFSEFFNEAWYEYLLCNKGISTGMWISDYLKVYDIGIIDENVIYERMLSSPAAADYIRVLTSTKFGGRFTGEDNEKMLKDYPFINEMIDKAVDVILRIESKRGEMATDVSELANAINKFEGSEYFAMLLAALGKDTFFRGYSYMGYDNKKSLLSSLLKKCYPRKDESYEDLEKALSDYKISKERLVEAAMYAPQWAAFVEKIVGWKGLKSGVWFYHAHVNEHFSAEKETEVARFSAISPQQFNDGTFDRDWYFKVKEELGPKRLKVLYDSAKYISEGNSHRRSQQYVDAVSGKLKISEFTKEIKDKRNQDKLRAYPLIPIKSNQTKEPLKRYEFIQKFLKESKQFGAQRRESEAKAVAVALENLAITTGYNDVNRMTWYLESEKMDRLQKYFDGIDVGDIRVSIRIKEDGAPEISVEKEDKTLKSVPKKYNKDKNIVELKAVVKELKDQRSRSRHSLERAMIDRVEFSSDELLKILGNPVLAPMMRSMIWMTEGQFGILSLVDGKLQLTGVDDSSSVIGESSKGSGSTLILAHPYDMLEAGNWSDLQHYLYENKIVQPFKQVFREFYPITEDEAKAKNESKRYAGNQVQPQRTIGLLRSRGWTVDYDQGLQKVLYKEDVIAVVYAMADWFSPAEIEPPTLETIRFYNRSNNDPVDFKDISPVVFSEVMRDMDLVVSVAHAGGVDPEASHSTVEMRVAIAKELTALLKLDNVEFTSAHAKIKGSMGNYSVHMGSGVVHQEAKGMLSIIPVHSQSRGRIFLPFADDDPKTAEIMSKIILLSEDEKIKDPTILSQIKPKK